MPDLGYADSTTNITEFSKDSFLVSQATGEMSIATVVEVVRAPYDRNDKDINPGDPVPIGFIDVKPLVNQVNGDNSANPHGTVYKLSYHRYQSGYGAIIADPKVGDQGKIVASDRDTSIVKQTNAAGNPGSNRRNDKADGTYFGMTQGKDAPKQYLAWKKQGFDFVDDFGNMIQGTKDGLLLNGVLIPQKGITFNLKTHVHAQGNDSNGDSEVPTNAPTDKS